MTLAARLRARWAETEGVPPAFGADDMAFAGEPAAAAVLAAVVDRPEPTLILTRRDANLRRHPGQVAFPGGRADREDDGPVATALREAEEEVAMPPARVAIVGCDRPYRTGSGFAIVPVLGVVPPGLPLVPREVEVAEIFEVPLAFLLDPENRIAREAEVAGHRRRYIEYRHDRHRIWGATAAMIANLARRIGGG